MKQKYRWLDIVIIVLMLLQLFILEYLGYETQCKRVISVLIVLRLVLAFGKRVLYNRNCFTVVVVLVLITVSSVIGAEFSINMLISSLKLLGYPMLYAVYLCFLCTKQAEFVDTLMEHGFGLFNGMMLLNLFVMEKQLINPYSFRAATSVGSSQFLSMAEIGDTVSGLFVFAGTHVVCFYTLFVIIYDLAFIKKCKKKWQKAVISILLLFIGIVSLLLAAENNNKAMFIMLPLALLAYVSMDYRKQRTEKIMWGLLLFVIAIAAISVLVPDFAKMINEQIADIFSTVNRAVNIGTSANGSDERIAIIKYALSFPKTWILGMGFGCFYANANGFFGFRHFGQGDLGTLLVLGGIWITALFIVFYFRMYAQIVDIKRIKHNAFPKICLLLIILCAILYSQVLSRTSFQITILLLMLTLRQRINATFKLKE